MFMAVAVTCAVAHAVAHGYVEELAVLPEIHQHLACILRVPLFDLLHFGFLGAITEVVRLENLAELAAANISHQFVDAIRLGAEALPGHRLHAYLVRTLHIHVEHDGGLYLRVEDALDAHLVYVDLVVGHVGVIVLIPLNGHAVATYRRHIDDGDGEAPGRWRRVLLGTVQQVVHSLFGGCDRTDVQEKVLHLHLQLESPLALRRAKVCGLSECSPHINAMAATTILFVTLTAVRK